MVTLIVKNRTLPVRCPFISGVNSRGGKQIYGANAGHGMDGDGDDGLKEGDLSCSLPTDCYRGRVGTEYVCSAG